MLLKFLISLGVILLPICSYGAGEGDSYAESLVRLATDTYVETAVKAHVDDTDNPHKVTAAQVGLGNIKNLDTTDADNITSGTLATERLKVGTTAGTVAAGDDARFYTIPTTQPTGNPPAGSVFVWFD